MLKGANKRSLKVVSNARIGIPTSLNKEGEAMIDFSGLFKHLHKTKFVHPSHWLPGAATGANVTKPSSSVLKPAVTLGISSKHNNYIMRN